MRKIFTTAVATAVVSAALIMSPQVALAEDGANPIAEPTKAFCGPFQFLCDLYK